MENPFFAGISRFSSGTEILFSDNMEISASCTSDASLEISSTLRNKNMRGDHYVTLVVQVPEKLNAAQKEALLAFDAAMDGEASKMSGNDMIDESAKKDKKKKGLFHK